MRIDAACGDGCADKKPGCSKINLHTGRPLDFKRGIELGLAAWSNGRLFHRGWGRMLLTRVPAACRIQRREVINHEEELAIPS